MFAATEPRESDPTVGLPLPPRVLIAEDHDDQAALLAAHLRALGIQIVGPASTTQQTLDLARASRPDLALLDIRMPDGDGIDTARLLQAEFAVPVILVSAYTDDGYVQRGASVGVAGYLVKPVTVDQLRAAIAVAWAASAERRRLVDEVNELRTALADRKIIERAKGMLMDQHGLKEADAMRRLQKDARNSRRRLVDVAREMLDGHPGHAPATPDAGD